MHDIAGKHDQVGHTRSNRRGDRLGPAVIEDWRPEDKQFWEGKKLLQNWAADGYPD